MNEVDSDIVFLLQVFGQMLGAIDGAVLASRAAERDLQMAEPAFDKTLHMVVRYSVHRL
jgi:hypothetical protein